MSLNREIICICKKLNATRSIGEKADYFLRKLDRKTNGSMGSMDTLKYLICVDLAFRELQQKWDLAIANTLGLKSRQYNLAFTKIQNKLNITKNQSISFRELAQQFKCSHIQSSIFDKTYRQYQAQKIQQLPLLQRKNTDLTTPHHKAAVFWVVAAKHGKVKVDVTKLCNVVHCEQKRFEAICADVRKICFESDSAGNSTASTGGDNRQNMRKRNRTQMADEDDLSMASGAEFCDAYETRAQRKHNQWKHRMLQISEQHTKEQSPKHNAKKRKIEKMGQAKAQAAGKPMKAFSIFGNAKRAAKVNKENDKTMAEEEMKLAGNDNDIDIEEDAVEQLVPSANAKQNLVTDTEDQKSQETVDARTDVMSAREKAIMAAMDRQKMIINSTQK